jgi:ubiquinone/menaquinone biosynthesis C-methylase UbiE
MSTPYDSYDYPRYWAKRKYEDLAEKTALRKLLKEVSSKGRLIDIGSGFGRLATIYAPLFKHSLLVDPSKKLLKLAKTKLKKYSKIAFKKGKVEDLPVGDKQFDVALMVRVAHHLPRLEKAFQEANRVLKPGGFFILEFANKIHLKSVLKALLTGRLNYLLSHVPENISTHKNVLFFNYHPTHIKSLLQTKGFKIMRTVSVSNFRAKFFKKIFPAKRLIWLELCLQPLLARLHFGPSIFILAQKS